MTKKFQERFMQIVFLVAACASVLAVALICIFLFANGLPDERDWSGEIPVWAEMETVK